MKNVKLNIQIDRKNHTIIYEYFWTNPQGRTFRRTLKVEVGEECHAWSYQRLGVVAVRYGLMKLKEGCNVLVTVNNRYIWQNAENLIYWRRNYWHSASGKEIANAYSWQQLVEVAKQHVVTIRYNNELRTLKAA